MTGLLTRLGLTTLGKLGGCEFCMRAAFNSAASAWLMTGALFLADASTLIIPVAIIALLLSLLWLTHLMAFGTRVVASRKHAARSGSNTETGNSRREVFSLFARSIGIAAAMTAWPTALGRALAADDAVPCSNCTQYKQTICWDCCICIQQNCKDDVNTCNKAWQDCNASCK